MHRQTIVPTARHTPPAANLAACLMLAVLILASMLIWHQHALRTLLECQPVLTRLERVRRDSNHHVVIKTRVLALLSIAMAVFLGRGLNEQGVRK